MKLEMEELIEEHSLEIDIDYEFDAPKFFDFTRTETGIETEEAERWFEIGRGYPPSPILKKRNWRWRPNTPVQNCSNEVTGDINTELKTNEDVAEESAKPKTKSPVKSCQTKSAKFMDPTASKLAKQNPSLEVQCERLQRMFQKFTVKNEEKSMQCCSSIRGEASKRQKLEAGYSWKFAHLKHQALFLHKPTKKNAQPDFNATVAKPKLTIPKEPVLQTACRAEKHRSKLETIENEKSNSFIYKARSLNRKIFHSPSVSLPKKTAPQLPEFQVFHLRTSERALQHVGDHMITQRLRPLCQVKSHASLREKLKVPDEFQASCLSKKEYNGKTHRKNLSESVTESFSKLSLSSGVSSSTKTPSKMPLHSKGSKETMPDSSPLQQEKTKASKSQRLGGNHYQCGNIQRMLSPEPQIIACRSLDIH